jgi:hypothetical protein
MSVIACDGGRDAQRDFIPARFYLRKKNPFPRALFACNRRFPAALSA